MRRDVAQAAQNAKCKMKKKNEWKKKIVRANKPKPRQSYESHKTFAMGGNE